ncbi:MAG: cytochrome bc complex cytochrome b subunit [Burkholderia sp.]|nr:cytochrome bc complex cytochrome b subunit [Burkholderia sp.]
MAIEHEVETTGLVGWIDRRFPFTSTWKKHVSEYYAPKNFNFWYFFGSLALLVLVNQIVTGIFLTMNYKPDATLAFGSVEYIMREVPWGMAEAFFGYLLPWGQMSFWGAQVIVNLFSAIPFIGPDLSLWIRGDYVVSDVTLNRFFAFHVIAIPLVLLGLVVAHLVALHEVGSNNPDGIEIKAKKDPDGIPLDGIPFHPYYSVHDFYGVCIFLMIFAAIIFFAPEMGGYFLEANNFVPANPLHTPPEIAPVWYFTAFYAMLRATTDPFKIVLMIVIALLGLLALVRARGKWKLGLPVLAVLVILAMAFTESKFWGVVVMGGAVVSLFFLPWLDRSPVKSIRYRPFFHKVFYGIFVLAFLTLAFLGTKPPSPVATLIAQVCALIYFAFFLGMPFWTRLGTFGQPPERVRYKPH